MACELGKKADDWERNDVLDDVFDAEGDPILTRQRSVTQNEDGTFDADESVPEEVRAMLAQIELEKRGPTGVKKLGSVSKGADGSLETTGDVPQSVLNEITTAEPTFSQIHADIGKKTADWERRSDTDNVFDAGGDPILTRQRSVTKNDDGTFEVDESVPENVRAMLSKIEAEKKSRMEAMVGSRSALAD